MFIETRSTDVFKTTGASAPVVTTTEAIVTPVGQAFYGFGSGTYTWKCPPGVTSVGVVAIGGGAGSAGDKASGSGGGCGGGLGWRNNIAVVPGTDYTVVVGKGGDANNSNAYAGGDSYFISTAIVKGGGALAGVGPGSRGTFTGDGGGLGGNSVASSPGGGAGGYTGNGGVATGNGNAVAGSGGAGASGGSNSSTYGYSSGGGTGPFGQGASGAGGYQGGGEGGSGGENGTCGENGGTSNFGNTTRTGGLYGGGAGGPGDNLAQGQGYQKGGRGCVRIIWGAGRFFPSTGTGDM